MLGIFAFAVLALARVQVSAADLHTPAPPYPPEQARQAHVTMSCLCGIVFDASGSVSKAFMLKSTGSDLLDQTTLEWARKNWTGKPNSRVKVPVTYKLSPTVQPPSGAFHTPLPPYSHLALTHNLMGEGQYEVSFGANGHAFKVVTIKSTGSGILDSRTVEWATLYWTGPPNTKTDVRINYVIR